MITQLLIHGYEEEEEGEEGEERMMMIPFIINDSVKRGAGFPVWEPVSLSSSNLHPYIDPTRHWLDNNAIQVS